MLKRFKGFGVALLHVKFTKFKNLVTKRIKGTVSRKLGLFLLHE